MLGDPVAGSAFTSTQASVNDIEGLVALRKILLSQGSGHYVATSHQEDLAWQVSYRSWLKKHIEESTNHIQIIVTHSLDKSVVGCAIGIIDDRAPMSSCLNGVVGWVQTVVVVPSLRGCGLAQQAMNLLLQWFSFQRVTKVALQTTPVALHMYERLGFVLSGEDLLIKAL